MKDQSEHKASSGKTKTRMINVLILVFLFGLMLALIHYTGKKEQRRKVPVKITTVSSEQPRDGSASLWEAPKEELIDQEPHAERIRYGKRLVAATSVYLGPKGSVAQLTNGMNCQNCHLEAGTKLYANNYAAVASTYPKFRERSGKVENIYKRVKDCFERSLNGNPPDSMSKEMRAIIAYINWLGKEVPKGEKPEGSGLVDLPFMERAADPEKGRTVYISRCQNCHGENGEGQLTPTGNAYLYPPLWGNNSYNTGAGLHRLSRFAGYVKTSMPNGASYTNPQLSDEEAWDLAAFVNSQPRPTMDLSKDWPKKSGKPVDHPYGPYTDGFNEAQHKYGPFGPIVALREKNKKSRR